MPKVTVDGVEIEVPQGATVLLLARSSKPRLTIVKCKDVNGDED